MEVLQIITTICALITSVVSIILTVITIKIQHRHNLKSVRPIGYITVGDYENDIYVSIINNGIGPMLIKGFKATNERVSSDSSLIDIIPNDLNEQIVWSDFASTIIGRTLKPGDRMYLIRLKIKEEEIDKEFYQKIKKSIREFLKNVKIVIEYTDIYEKNKYNISRKLEWFGRHFIETTTQKQQYHGER